MYTKDKPETIQRMFGSIAQQYDRGNAILSFQMHRWWNQQLVSKVLKPALVRPGTRLLDLCCGTGEIAFSCLKRQKAGREAILLDFCPEMLDCAREKAKKLPLEQHEIQFIQGDAQELPLEVASVDCVSVAYGIRNIQDPNKCIAEAYRVLRTGGRFGILELTRPKNPVMRLGHNVYLRMVLPAVGKLVLSNGDAYQYLCNSIHSFVSPDALEKSMRLVGFRDTRQYPLLGGVATLITATR